MADSKKAHFLKSPILKIFSRKFLRFVLGLVGLNDAKGIDVAQCIWPLGCPTKAQERPKNAFSVLFGCFPWFPENSLLCVILRYTVYVLECIYKWLNLRRYFHFGLLFSFFRITVPQLICKPRCRNGVSNVFLL